jgi:fido (protein-threonine AMPylation protein)
LSSKDSYFAEFFQLSAAILVYHANRLEQAIGPTVIEGETYVLIKGFCDGSRPPPTPRSWDAEGGREDTLASSDRQLWQFLRAARYLCEEHVHDDLSIQLLCETHRLMMEGSISYGQPTASGLRTQLANAGYYVFVAPQYIDRALQGMIKTYKEQRDSGMHPIELATQLFYTCITIHPFVNGNGRLCRLLISWALMREGFPFFVSFSSGHRKRRQHYLHAINRAREPVVGHLGELSNIALISCQRILSNYL